ncbi:Auxilin-related protein 1 isoform C [Glycine soja]|uniref:Auxilin-related protein 1 isoform B n=1 Tax=Glycine soja TaxID=3848 RepID=A0A445KCI3_GLYSO|nr:Auxilin-related protein 1 isoform B [Glycine soja]RZC08524.1 Auxilin-related protein 1 isoform C [Glycine soja]
MFVLNTTLKGFDDTPQSKSKAAARWIIIKGTNATTHRLEGASPNFKAPSLSSTRTASKPPKSTLKFLCSYGGKILLRYPDGKLRYLGGHTCVLAVDRSIPFSELLLKLEELCGASVRHLRCQLPSEDLDALVSITSDEDLTKPHRGIRSHHRHDAARAENALTLLYGNEPIGMQRDWNEELQSCREFPRTSPQKRILRDRALYKVTSDFVDAAINGAIGVISGCIPPINLTDPECFHMYVHNNIFFSFAIDADLEKLSKKLVDANSKSWSSNSLQSSSDKDSIPVHGESQVPNGGKDDGSSSEDLNSTEISEL